MSWQPLEKTGLSLGYIVEIAQALSEMLDAVASFLDCFHGYFWRISNCSSLFDFYLGFSSIKLHSWESLGSAIIDCFLIVIIIFLLLIQKLMATFEEFLSLEGLTAKNDLAWLICQASHLKCLLQE